MTENAPAVPERKVDIQIRAVEFGLWAALRAAAIARGQTVGALLNAILRDWLGRQAAGER